MRERKRIRQSPKEKEEKGGADYDEWNAETIDDEEPLMRKHDAPSVCLFLPAPKMKGFPVGKLESPTAEPGRPAKKQPEQHRVQADEDERGAEHARELPVPAQPSAEVKAQRELRGQGRDQQQRRRRKEGSKEHIVRTDYISFTKEGELVEAEGRTKRKEGQYSLLPLCQPKVEEDLQSIPPRDGSTNWRGKRWLRTWSNLSEKCKEKTTPEHYLILWIMRRSAWTFARFHMNEKDEDSSLQSHRRKSIQRRVNAAWRDRTAVEATSHTQQGVPATISGEVELRSLNERAKSSVFVRKLAMNDFGLSVDVPRLWCDTAATLQLPRQIGVGQMGQETRTCNPDPCPIDCSWEPYGPWGECSKTCGGGEQTRTRAFATAAAHGGAACTGEAEETKECNEQACPIDCKFTDWSEWGECSKTCRSSMLFGSRKQRTREIETEAAHGGAECVGSTNQGSSCPVPYCSRRRRMSFR
eukprot:s4452_g4.t1